MSSDGAVPEMVQDWPQHDSLKLGQVIIMIDNTGCDHVLGIECMLIFIIYNIMCKKKKTLNDLDICEIKSNLNDYAIVITGNKEYYTNTYAYRDTRYNAGDTLNDLDS